MDGWMDEWSEKLTSTYGSGELKIKSTHPPHFFFANQVENLTFYVALCTGMLTIHMLNLKKVAALIQINFINFLWVQQPKKKIFIWKIILRYIEKVVNIIHWLAVQIINAGWKGFDKKFFKKTLSTNVDKTFNKKS